MVNIFCPSPRVDPDQQMGDLERRKLLLSFLGKIGPLEQKMSSLALEAFKKRLDSPSVGMQEQ